MTPAIALLAIIGPLGSLGLLAVIKAERPAKWLAVAGAAFGLLASLTGLLVIATSGNNTGSGENGLPIRPVEVQLRLPGLPGQPLRVVVEPLTALLGVVVALVSLAVMIYTAGYMQEEKGQRRFFAQMSFFVAAMQVLVFAGDWLLVLAAWELIGLASYLLIGFWYDRPGARQAATRAFLTTRAADLGLYLAVFGLVSRTGTTEIGAATGLDSQSTTWIGLGLLLAAAGKSAQLPLQGWLQDAMAGPTPVSALLHSATLVAAGPILLLRAYPLLAGNPLILTAIGLVGGLTALFAGGLALIQSDLKRMLAASTSSQLGFMLLAIGAGSPGAALVHLVAHAAMKSTLFLGAGVFQHAYHSTSFEEIRAAGGGRRYPLAFGGFALAGLALAGVPPLAGFWSKDLVIAAGFNSNNGLGWLFGGLALGGTLMTGLYIGRTLRLLWPVSGSGQVVPRPTAGKPDPASTGKRSQERLMLTGLLALAGLAAIGGLSVGPITHLLNLVVPENSFSWLAGLAAALGGLAGGWFRLGRIWADLDGSRNISQGWQTQALPWSQRLRSVGEGAWLDILAVRPVLYLASRIDRADLNLHAGVLYIGRKVLGLARLVARLDVGVHSFVRLIGKSGLVSGYLSRRIDEKIIDGLIAGLVRESLALGGWVRRLQSGLVHRQLLLTAGAVAVLLGVILIAR